MCEHFGYEVKKLERVRIMNIVLKGLPVGEWRQLDGKELESLLKMTENSSSTVKSSGAGDKKPVGKPKGIKAGGYVKNKNERTLKPANSTTKTKSYSKNNPGASKRKSSKR